MLAEYIERRFIMGKASFKKCLINSLFSTVQDVDGFEANDVILATSSGIISGKLISESEFKEMKTSRCAIAHICQKFANEYSENNELAENDGYLFLVDVKAISSDGKSISLPFVVVFQDQITGISFGCIN